MRLVEDWTPHSRFKKPLYWTTLNEFIKNKILISSNLKCSVPHVYTLTGTMVPLHLSSRGPTDYNSTMWCSVRHVWKCHPWRYGEINHFSPDCAASVSHQLLVLLPLWLEACKYSSQFCSLIMEASVFPCFLCVLPLMPLQSSGVSPFHRRRCNREVSSSVNYFQFLRAKFRCCQG